MHYKLILLCIQYSCVAEFYASASSALIIFIIIIIIIIINLKPFGLMVKPM